MDWKLAASIVAIFVSCLSLIRGEWRGHRLRCEKFSEDQWSALRKELEARRDDFEKELVGLGAIALEGKAVTEQIEIARTAYKALITCHRLLARSAARCGQNSCVYEMRDWSSVALRPIVDGDTVTDQTGELFNKIMTATRVEEIVQALGAISALFDEMITQFDSLIRIENAHHDPEKYAPFSWVPFLNS